MSAPDDLDRREMLKAMGVFAVTVAVPPTLWTGCGEDPGPSQQEQWEQKVSEWENDIPVYDDSNPGTWADVKNTHLPIVTFNEGQGSVEVFSNHEMVAGHWIRSHYLRNQDGKLIGLTEYEPSDPSARYTFKLPKGTTEITAYCLCNLHDLWKSDQQGA